MKDVIIGALAGILVALTPVTLHVALSGDVPTSTVCTTDSDCERGGSTTPAQPW